VTEDWAAIVAQLRRLRQCDVEPLLAQARGGLERLAEHIAGGPLAGGLSAWLSMNDLCIRQSGAHPFGGPVLRVTALPSGMVEFRYEDTAVRARQWSREVPPEAVVGRWSAFLDQLRWVQAASPP